MSIRKVAEQAGVSVATVSRVFNFPSKVSEDTLIHVQQIALDLGYMPNASARSLRSQRSRVLGVVLPTLLNPVFAECLEGIAEAASQGGYSILPVTTDYRVENEQHAVNVLIAANVDGLILVVSNPDISSALERLSSASLPYVLAYNRHPEHPCVSVDSETAVSELILRLSRLGHRHIAMISGKVSASDRAQQRCRGYSRGMQAAGLIAQPIFEVPFVETAVDDIAAMLGQPSRPTALVCSNDLLAIRSIRAAYLAGLAAPRDISIVGFDGIALGEDLTPMLTTITQPNSVIGSSSVQLLIDALENGVRLDAQSSLTLAHGFRTGESCAPLATPANRPLT